ncbi:MAG: 3-deoxy-D-manno-octulosonic acid transferase [Verrucomicrobiota bacterium]|nr:3-deoxy-D-manno-octulosonic acid transferase [Verrucomicrobiota bacterium]
MRRRGGWKQGFGERLGRYSNKFKQSITNRDVIWLHAVSVGEVNICVQLVKVLQPKVPNIKLIISSTTSTGMSELHKRTPPEVGKIYYPIDLRSCVRRALVTIRPKAVILLEAEIWPNFLWGIQARNIPHFLVNTRISKKSYKNYRRFGFIFRSLFGGFTGVGAQSDDDAKKLFELGCDEKVVQVFGSCKFDDIEIKREYRINISSLLRGLGVKDQAPIIVAGSTHNGEEEILARLFKRLQKKYPDIFLILVPRHQERGKEVGEVLAKQSVNFVFRNQISDNIAPMDFVNLECLLVNTTGELRYFYEKATLVFVGKSLTAKGGQSPVEPAALAKPIIFGPHMGNFEEITAKFLSNEAAIQVADEFELEKAFELLIKDQSKRDSLGKAAQKVVRENEGAIEQTVSMILTAI